MIRVVCLVLMLHLAGRAEAQLSFTSTDTVYASSGIINGEILIVEPLQDAIVNMAVKPLFLSEEISIEEQNTTKNNLKVAGVQQ